MAYFSRNSCRSPQGERGLKRRIECHGHVVHGPDPRNGNADRNEGICVHWAHTSVFPAERRGLKWLWLRLRFGETMEKSLWKSLWICLVLALRTAMSFTRFQALLRFGLSSLPAAPRCPSTSSAPPAVLAAPPRPSPPSGLGRPFPSADGGGRASCATIALRTAKTEDSWRRNC